MYGFVRGAAGNSRPYRDPTVAEAIAVKLEKLPL